MTSAVAARVHAIVVTYHPDPDRLPMLLSRIAGQVEGVTVVDNASIEERESLHKLSVEHRFQLLALDRNVGVAAAHNLGITEARRLSTDAVLLLDQDSIPAIDMVSELRRSLLDLTGAGESVAAVGPQQVDERNGTRAPFVRFGYLKNEHLICDGSGTSSTVRCDHLITSGSFIPMAALDAIGELDEDLFIDNVDTEWCFRALSKGYRLFGVCSARMTHSVGDRLTNVRLPYPHQVVVHSPLRLYYMMRNRVLLYGRSYIPARWKFQDFPRLLLRVAVFATSISPRLSNISMIWKGLRDGIRGKTGCHVL